MKSFEDLCKKAFSEDSEEALEGSIELARSVGVSEEKILHNVEEIDNLFLKRENGQCEKKM